MSRARKTYPVGRLIDAANAQMIAFADRRNGLFWFTSDLLLEANAYRGFAYAHVNPVTDEIESCAPPEGHGGLTDPRYTEWVGHASDHNHLRLLYGGERLRYAENLGLRGGNRYPMGPLADPVEAELTRPSGRAASLA